ncbi:MAG: hypothetical protein H6P94_785 [Thermoplasmatales archaeon]|nr:hypothetical protein [Thermoplasmatales archaeon]
MKFFQSHLHFLNYQLVIFVFILTKWTEYHFLTSINDIFNRLINASFQGVIGNKAMSMLLLKKKENDILS